MTTPLGKTFHAFWFDSEGNPCEAGLAVTGEVTEYDEDGVLMRRTYVDRRFDPEATVGSESDPENEAVYPENADLLKMGTWDIWVPGWTKLVDTLQELLVALDAESAGVREQRDAVSSLMALPAWVPAPQQLKDEVLAWLVATIQE